MQPLWTNSMDERENLRYSIEHEREDIWPEKQWQWEKSRTLEAQSNNELEFVKSGNSWSVYYKQYLYDDEGQERAAKLFSVLDGPYTQAGTEELESLFGNGKVFSFPKPSALIRHLISTLWRDETPLVLDFFAGSCPTLHAAIEFNMQNNASVRVIAVQLPEPLPQDSIAVGMGLANVADVGRERVRRVLEKLQSPPKQRESKTKVSRPLGFRVFKLAESNFQRWSGTDVKDTEALGKQMEAFTDSLVKGWTTEKVIWEVALREGYSLSTRVERMPDVTGNVFWRVTDPERDQSFNICLDDKLTLDAFRMLKLGRDDLFVCRDKALDDTLAANLVLQCRLKVV